MKIIRDGNLANWLSSLLGFMGVNIAVMAVEFYSNGSTGQIVYLVIGVLILGLATNSDRASMWNIKPFGDLTFPKNKPGEKTPPESLFEKALSWFFFLAIVVSIYFWGMINK